MNKDTDIPEPKQVKPAADRRAAAPANVASSPMTAPAKPKTEASVRDARLKAALKANMARRKGQARARAGADTTPSGSDKNE